MLPKALTRSVIFSIIRKLNGGCGEVVNTADCGSVTRAFESRQPPQRYGNYRAMDTPGHISNPEVKCSIGDGSWTCSSESSTFPNTQQIPVSVMDTGIFIFQ